MADAFQIHPQDNVATLVADAAAGEELTIRGGSGVCEAATAIATGHKIAVAAVPAGAPVVKFGVPIGHATRAIAPGDWVHLHNLASDHDERSNTLDVATGAPADTPYE